MLNSRDFIAVPHLGEVASHALIAKPPKAEVAECTPDVGGAEKLGVVARVACSPRRFPVWRRRGLCR